MNMIKQIKQLILLIFILNLATPVYSQEISARDAENKMLSTISLINRYYVETPPMDKLVEKGIIEMLKTLDPHSIYISAKEVEKANEPLEGNFDGIGVSFQILNDTINVVEVISGGPSEKLGILAGDKIIKIDGKPATGDSITNSFVYKNLRGKKGTIVEVLISRQGKPDPILFKITRDKIPINSIDTYFMIDKKTGYIRLERFSRTSMNEFREALADLRKQGLTQLIFDLRGNGGGYLDVAVDLSNEFLEKDKLIVYTEGVTSPKQPFVSGDNGGFTKGKLIILIDEGSASASEIVSGAVQDWDRGLIVGRRSFGKGLVQRIFNLTDRSQIRLTTSRYYTPSGRCIQKPYNDGVDDYYNDYLKRLNHRELVTPDSIKFPDSLKYFTNSKRVVYGGGGIMPDVFVAIDTLRASDYLINLRSKGIFNNYALDWANKHRDEVLAKYPKCEDFLKHYNEFRLDENFESYANSQNVFKTEIKKEWVNSWASSYLREYANDTANKSKYASYEKYTLDMLSDSAFIRKMLDKAIKEDKESAFIGEKSEEYIAYTLKGLVVRNLYGIKYYYKVTSDIDDGFKRALEIINDEKLYEALLKGGK